MYLLQDETLSVFAAIVFQNSKHFDDIWQNENIGLIFRLSKRTVIVKGRPEGKVMEFGALSSFM